MSDETDKKEAPIKGVGHADDKTVEAEEKRYVMLEISCTEKHCDPCTYPNCQRFAREAPRGTPTRSWMFEIKKENWKSLVGEGEKEEKK